MLNFFDPSFRAFTAPTLIKVYYGLSVGLLVLGWVVMLLAGFGRGFGAGVVVLFLGPLVAFFLLLGTRLACEWILATIQTAQHTQRLVDIMETASTWGHVPGGMAGNGPLQRYMAAPPIPPAR